MGYIDKIWDRISSEQFDNKEQRLNILIDPNCFEEICNEYCMIPTDDYNIQPQPKDVTVKELSSFFGANVILTNSYLDVGFEIDEQV